MTYTYFTKFYQNICDILSVNTGMPSQASSLVSSCDSDIVRIKGYLNEIIGSKWKESGALIIRNNIVNQISKNVGEVNNFIKSNLEKAAAISINKLLPELKDMKTQDELLYKNKTTLESKKSSLTILQNNMPTKYKTDEEGIKHLRDEYTAAVNKVNSLIQETNELSKTIMDQIQALNTLKGVVDGFIMDISTLGNENIVIPVMTLPSENDFDDLPLLSEEEEVFDLQSYEGIFDIVRTEEVIDILGKGTKATKVYLSNGKSFIIYDQRTLRRVEGEQLRHSNYNLAISGCGNLALASVLNYLTGKNITPMNVYNVSGGSSYGSFFNVFEKGKIMTDTDGRQYRITSDVSPKLNPREMTAEEFDAVCTQAFKSNGVVILNVAQPATGKNRAQLMSATGIESDGGHMIALMGKTVIDGKEYIIAADSWYVGTNKETCYLKKISLEDFHEYYQMRPTGTIVRNGARQEVQEYMLTIGSATAEEVTMKAEAN